MYIEWVEEDAGPVQLSLRSKTPPLLVRGNIVSAKNPHGKSDHYEILAVQDAEDHITATIRRITPNFWRTAALIAGLAAGWFLVEFCLGLLLN